MKKQLLAVLCIIMLFACGQKDESKITITNPIQLHGEKTDMSAYRWINDTNNAFIEISMAESIRMFSERGSGILVYGYPGCAFCERALPELNKAAKEHGVTVYYCNVYRPDVNASTFEQLRPLIEPIFDIVDGKPVFKVPEVIAIKNGEIVGHHLALLKEYKIEGEDSQMSEEQRKQLQDIYVDLFKAAAD